MIENFIKSLTRSILATVSAKYDADIAAMKAEIAAMKAASTTNNTTPSLPPEMPLYPPSDTTHPASTDTPIFEQGRPANIFFGIVSDITGAWPMGTYQGLKYDFDFEFVARPGIQVLQHYNNISTNMCFSNLEVVGEGYVDVIIYQRMYTPDANGSPDISKPVFIDRRVYAGIHITKASSEYAAPNLMGGIGAEQMYQMLMMNQPTINTDS